MKTVTLNVNGVRDLVQYVANTLFRTSVLYGIPYKSGIGLNSGITSVKDRLVKLLERGRRQTRTAHLAIRTEKEYLSWIERFLSWEKNRSESWTHPDQMGYRKDTCRRSAAMPARWYGVARVKTRG